jgi:hypothetical protein
VFSMKCFLSVPETWDILGDTDLHSEEAWILLHSSYHTILFPVFSCWDLWGS